MLGAYYPGQAYPGRTNKTIFGVYLSLESASHSQTTSDITLLQDYALQLENSIHSQFATDLVLISPLIIIDSYHTQTADTITIGIVVHPKPEASIADIKKARSYINKNSPISNIEKIIAHAPASIVVKPIITTKGETPKGINVKP